VSELPDGIHLHLDEDAYFAVPALGSSDLIKLYQQGEGWWWSSHFNKRRVERENAAKDFGRALHKIVLEGVDAYDATYAVAPEKSAFKGLCVTIDDLKEALADAGVSFKASARKQELVEACRAEAPQIPVWDLIMEAFDQERGQRLAIQADEDEQLRIMADAVHAHPEIGPLFAFNDTHLPLAEVSILYTLPDGTRRRARLDEMLPTATCDLKSMGNWSGRPLPFEVGKIVCDRGYDIQQADYHHARTMAYRFITEGKVFGASTAELAWLQRFPTEAPNWGWAWLFYQKPDPVAGRAPVLFPWWEDYGSDLHLWGYRKAHKALAVYRNCLERFGPDTPWSRVEPLHLSLENAKNRVFVPHYIADNDPAPDEKEIFA